ncbi:hypothetical protein ACFQL3_02515, partial [Natronoarchaeum sp. GCM10025321]|uniref:hypothetical protein n=1 Tax=Natronoarchaeum sp. GCM10025321 TaxID=3252684 RepID=UPI00360AE36C
MSLASCESIRTAAIPAENPLARNSNGRMFGFHSGTFQPTSLSSSAVDDQQHGEDDADHLHGDGGE